MKKVIPFLIVVALIFLGGLYIFGVRPVYTYTPQDQKESAAILNNPYEGMYRIYSYTLSDTDPTPVSEVAEELLGDGYRLCLLEVNLENYAEGELSETALTQLNDVLSVFDAGDRGVILRLLYDQKGEAKKVEPKSVEIVRDHIIAAAPIINRHVSCVFTLQGILIGDYGEMHDSNLLNEENISMLMDTMYSQIDPDIFLAVRTPWQWRLITKSDDPSTNRGITSRLGLFNDGLFGSEDDLGSYTIRPRSDEYNFQEVLCAHVPNGGEVVVDNEYNDYENARLDLKKLHISYLNSEYDPAVLNKWKNQKELTDPIWRGKSGYEYIENHLGYRYFISFSDALIDSSLTSADISMRVTLKNKGFAPAYRPFKGYIRLEPTGKKAGGDILLEVPTDFTTLMADETRSVDVPVTKGLENTDYKVWFYIEDEITGERIIPANENLNGTELLLGTLSCRSFLKK